jgi:transposase
VVINLLKTLNVGIDISLKAAAISLLTWEGKYLGKSFEIPNNLPGAKDIEGRLLSVLSLGNFEHIRFGMEATQHYGFHLAQYLAGSDKLSAWKPLVYLINAKYVKDFKRAFPERDKTDFVDSQFIAEYLRFGKLPHPFEVNNRYLPLERMVRYRYHLIKNIERETKFFLANLFLKFPSWVQNRPIKTIRKTAMDVLGEFYSLDEIIQTPLEELTLFVAKAGKNRSPKPEKIASQIKKAAPESYRLRPDLADSVQFILESITVNLRALRSSLKEVDKAIALEMKGFANPLLSIKGIGPVYAAGIFASIGNIKRFSSDNKIAKLAGLVWKRNQSGKFEAEERRLIRQADRYLRYYLVEAANSLRVHNEEYRAYYQKKYREVNKHQHKRALVLTARKLVRLAFAMLSKNQLYEPARAFQCAQPSQLVSSR